MKGQENVEADAMAYVLGLMEGRERRAFEVALIDDPALAAAVWRAEEGLMPFTEALKPRRPAASVWPSLRQRAFGAAPRPPMARERKASAFWQQVALLFATIATIATLAAAILAVRPDLVAGAAPRFVTALALEDEARVVTIASDGTLRASGVPTAAAAGQDEPLALWLAPQDGKAIMLGTLERNRPTTLQLPDGAASEIEEGDRLIVMEGSAEPSAGIDETSADREVARARLLAL